MRSEGRLESKLTRARTQLLLNQPFFGALCLRLKLTPGAVPTMSTDGRRILYDAKFVEELKPAELEAVLAHEVLHCALGHHCRRGERDPKLWNQAADLAINPILIANSFTLPAGALVDSSFANLSAEEIYARLSERTRSEASAIAKEPPPPPAATSQANDSQEQTSGAAAAAGGGSPAPPAEDPGKKVTRSGPQRPGAFGEVLDATDEEGKGASPAEQSHQQQEWSIAADQAIRAAKACGHEPANVERPLTESREARQDWRSILREFVAARTPSDYRWSPPNRRYVAAGIYLPSVARSGLGTVVIGVDSSGSIGSKELEQFAGEISAIADEAQPEFVHVVYCDAAVQGAQEFHASEPIRLEPKGGGGTDFVPVFEWVEKNDVQPVCLIYFTDLCCDSYPQAPDYPVLWVTTSRRTAQFGETLRMSQE